MPIDYTPYVQDAFRDLVRRVLTDVSRQGLPDGSHFFISFQTDRTDVIIPEFVRAKYPKEMSIILQHQFDNLVVGPHSFAVDLAFGGVASTLSIPFTALTQFADPGADFGFVFQPERSNATAQNGSSKKTEKGGTAEIIDLNSRRKS